MKKALIGVAVALALAATALAAPAAAQTASDIETRDNLIAAQENLANAYRCQFGADTQLVPGGCGDPARVSPGPAPANPTQNDIEARETLIAAQEELLNAYRCQFDADTQLVPGGCPDNTTTPETGTAISAGSGHSCGIRADGSAVCWGPNFYGEADAPEGRFTAISAGSDHSCGIRADGSAACWGDNDYGEADAPEGRFTAISAGSGHSCGIRADGSAACWGLNGYGEADAPEGRFTAISAGSGHSCGIRADGSAVCWGFNRHGQADAPAGRFTAISAGDIHSCGIRADGSAVCWGHNGKGRADAPEGRFTAISAGEGHSCGIRADGSAACWGDNFAGGTQCGSDGCRSNSEGPTDAPSGRFTAISAGLWHSCGIKADESAACWGNNFGGQADAPEGVFGPPAS